MTFKFGNVKSDIKKEISNFLSAEDARKLQFEKNPAFSEKIVITTLENIFTQVNAEATSGNSFLDFDLSKESKPPGEEEESEIISRLIDYGYLVSISGTILTIKWVQDGKV